MNEHVDFMCVCVGKVYTDVFGINVKKRREKVQPPIHKPC